MRFLFNRTAYVGGMTYTLGSNFRTITAIFDTGCSVSSIGLYSLSKLINKSYDYILSLIEPSHYASITQDASGGFHNNVAITLANISLSDMSYDVTYLPDVERTIKFDRFYCNLNIEDKLIENNGECLKNGKRYIAQPYILIGCDFIRTFENISINSKMASLGKFDRDKYFKEVECKRGNSLFLFSDIPTYMKEEI